MKCNKQLDPGNCKLSGSQIERKFTALIVKNTDITASYKGCQSLIDLKKSTREESDIIMEKKEKKMLQLNSYIKKNVSFTETLRNNIKQDSNRQNSMQNNSK